MRPSRMPDTRLMDTYTHTRIRKEYLDKLQALAARHKRSAMKQLEVLIDGAVNNLTRDGAGKE